jgi:hypothetical protein
MWKLSVDRPKGFRRPFPSCFSEVEISMILKFSVREGANWLR